MTPQKDLVQRMIDGELADDETVPANHLAAAMLRLRRADAAGKEMANALDRLNWTHPAIVGYPAKYLTVYADDALAKWERYEVDFETPERPEVAADALCALSRSGIPGNHPRVKRKGSRR